MIIMKKKNMQKWYFSLCEGPCFYTVSACQNSQALNASFFFLACFPDRHSQCARLFSRADAGKSFSKSFFILLLLLQRVFFVLCCFSKSFVTLSYFPIRIAWTSWYNFSSYSNNFIFRFSNALNSVTDPWKWKVELELCFFNHLLHTAETFFYGTFSLFGKSVVRVGNSVWSMMRRVAITRTWLNSVKLIQAWAVVCFLHYIFVLHSSCSHGL